MNNKFQPVNKIDDIRNLMNKITFIPRDPKRINKVLKLLKRYWTKYPDLRLGQILGSFAEENVYFYEDNELIGRLEKELKDK